ncbi:hypothetical protein KSX_15040 [Ktedonospora formicarum]|uniref:Uncharacterized protein n=1 Tax=Ktedonospora formicarum TaxID=2778364 RepID=A0A8J3HU61_9CHLR|nr:hypothetical protein KSX_15040 [Ktedonospora formicarum]
MVKQALTASSVYTLKDFDKRGMKRHIEASLPGSEQVTLTGDEADIAGKRDFCLYADRMRHSKFHSFVIIACSLVQR